MGFVFAQSRRKITIETAARIAQSVPHIGKAGVFVNQPLAEVREIADYCGLNYVQLHGDESPEYCQAVGVPVIKGFSVGPDFGKASTVLYNVEYFLLDSLVAGKSGGTGISFDWCRSREVAGELTKPFLVAGGLTPDNVAEAIRVLTPDGVDVSGGVETGGEKDVEKIRLFIDAARKAEESGRFAK
ncbi:MAG: trpF [Firmicutes bacterium]|nr:trpF [Bacillota bacterium]